VGGGTYGAREGALQSPLLRIWAQTQARPRLFWAYIGLIPKRSQSGASDARLGITKAGDALLRKLLVNCAQYILGPFGKDSALRQWGLRIAERRASKTRAAVAVARKLAVIMVSMWKSQQDYELFPGGAK